MRAGREAGPRTRGRSPTCLHIASMMSMRTLYIRNVPDDVAAGLESLAAAEGLSLNALAVKELTHAARRADNARILAELPVLDLDMDEVVADIRAGRTAR